MPDRTISEAASQLRTVVNEIKALLDDHYQKRVSSQRMVKFIFLSLIASMLFSVFFTLSTVSNCFLVTQGSPSEYCNYIPGFEDAQKRNNDLIKEFKELQQRSKANERRIDRLEGN